MVVGGSDVSLVVSLPTGKDFILSRFVHTRSFTKLVQNGHQL
jgi:hypothetical protein